MQCFRHSFIPHNSSMRLVLYTVPFLKWFHRQRSLVGYSPWRSSVRHDGATNTFTFTFHSLGHSGRSISFRCCCSVAQVCLTLCNPMDCSTPGFLVLHNHLELAQTWVHWVSGAIQSSSPLFPPSPPALSLSQHQGLFQWVSSSHQVAKELNLQHQSFQWIFRTDFL